MERRTFIAISAIPSLWSSTIRAQPATRAPIVGIVLPTALTTGINAQTIVAIRKGLRDQGFVEGESVVLDVRSADGNPQALPGIAQELVRLQVAVLCVFGPGAVRAALAASSTVPIVALDLETDPVQAGWAQTLAKPGGNVTGLFLNLSTLAGKWLELLRTMLPSARRVAVLWDSTTGPGQLSAMTSAARGMAIELQVIEVRTTSEVDSALRAGLAGGPEALALLSSPITRNLSQSIAEFTLANRLPGISPFRQFVEYGGLMSYGPNLADFFPRCAVYIGRLLKGAKAAELPIEQPTKYELIFNLKTAKALGMAIPQSLRLRADEAIQ